MRPRSLPLAALCASPLFASGDGEDALLIVDPASSEALYVANYYADARDLPAGNRLFLDPSATSYAVQATVNVEGFLGELSQRALDAQIDYVILPAGGGYRIAAPGLVNDNCSPVNNFTVPAAYTLAHQRANILGGLQLSDPNHYSNTNWVARGFDSTTTWRFGTDSQHALAERYYIGAQLGYTGQNGNTLAEVLATIDRSVAVHGAHPVGTVYYMETTDQARSGPRHGAYPAAVTQMVSAGGAGQHLLAVLPLGQHDCMGVMTGWASPDIDAGDFTLLPGAFADHLTSYAGHFGTTSQTKMSRWIAKGASGTAGTVEEPCNYPGKFPHARVHVVYRKGLSLGESWFRSVQFKPFQNLFLGDPLTRPYAEGPLVDVPSPPQGAVAGVVQLDVSATPVAAGAGIATLEALVDGVPVASGPDGQPLLVDTTVLTDGWHDLRVRAIDDKLARNTGVWKGALDVDNDGLAVTLTPGATSGDLATRFDLTYATAGDTPSEVRLLHAGRVVASASGPAGTLSTFGQNVGAGPVRVQAEALFAGGRAARSAPVTLDVAYDPGSPAGAAPLAYGYSRRLRDDAAFVLELPAAFDGDPAGAVYTLLAGPSQATRLSTGTSGAWQVFTPDAGAAGADSVTFRVDTPSGSSNVATILLDYFDRDPCPAAEPYCVGAPNSVGAGALIGHTGSLSLAANDLVLIAGGCPPGEFGIFFYGQGQTQTPLGDGFLCVASNHARYGALSTDGAGNASQPVDYGAPPLLAAEITVGSTWSFQFWYRDPGAGGAGSNTTDAFEATFCE
jgi:uncharacterized protein (TIGR03790 family)